MRIVVTGGMGFIGHEIVRDLLNYNCEVVCVDKYDALLREYETKKNPIIERIYENCSRPNFSGLLLPEKLVGCGNSSFDVLVHAGANVDTKNLGGQDQLYDNVDFTREICHVGNSIVFISSAATYGLKGYPNNPYGLTKVLGEKIFAATHRSLASLRLFNVFGKYESHKGQMASVPWKIADRFRRGMKFDIHSFSSKRDFVPVSSVVSAVNAAVWSPSKTRGTYDVGTGTASSYDDLVKMMARVLGVEPHQLVNVIDRPEELTGRFQEHTQAGTHGIPMLGNGKTTEDGLGEYYGS